MNDCLAWRLATCLLVVLQPSIASSDGSFTIHAGDIRTNEPIGRRHLNDGAACAGENLSPELRWKGAPSGTRSYAVTAVNRDAPDSPGKYHWIVVNVPSRWTGLPRGIQPFSAAGGILQSRNDFGKRGWFGPCVPPATTPNRYVFTVYALDVETLPVAADTEPPVMDAHIRRHVIAITTLTAIHPRWGAAHEAGDPGIPFAR